MFAGFNREVRNSLRLMGLRIRYAVAAVEIAAEQYGAVVANNIDLLLSPRGSGRVRIRGNSVTVGNDQTATQVTWGDPEIVVARASDRNVVLRMDNNRAALLNPVTSLSLSAAWGVFISSSGVSAGADDAVGIGNTGFTIGRNLTSFSLLFNALATDRAPTSLAFSGCPAFASATTNITGGAVTITGGAGASGSSGAASGGNVNLVGGQGYGTGARGLLRLGTDGTNVCRVTVRNTILGINGYTSTAADPTTTELPTAGDYGIHKNTTSGTVYLAFNDAGTIKKVALA